MEVKWEIHYASFEILTAANVVVTSWFLPRADYMTSNAYGPGHPDDVVTDTLKEAAALETSLLWWGLDGHQKRS